MAGERSRTVTGGAPPGGLVAVIHPDGYAHHIIEIPKLSTVTVVALDEDGNPKTDEDGGYVFESVEGPPERDPSGNVVVDRRECAEHLIDNCVDCGGRKEDHPVEFTIGGKTFVYCEGFQKREDCPCGLPRHNPD